MLRLIEVQFLQTVIRDNIGTLAEETVQLLVEYLHGVIQMSPVVTQKMDIADTVAQLLTNHVDSSTVTKLILESVLP